MYIRYGTYTHALDECGVATQRVAITEGGIQIGVEETWTITGFLQAASQSALITALTALEIAYSINQRDLVLLLNDGTTVARSMPGFHVLGGTEVIEGPSYPIDGTGANGAEFVNFRTFTIKVRGRYALTTPSPNQLLSWTETLEGWGGGPRRKMRENLYGRPRGQTLVQQTIYYVMQKGSAIGLLAWPTPPIQRNGSGALWPAALVEAPRIAEQSPKRNGSNGAPAYTEYQVDWSASYESDVPLLGRPAYWR